MKRRPTARPAAAAGESAAGVLAAIVGHELNNIAVPLQGFTELAQESAEGNAAVSHSLGEIQIAIDRIQALAADLESLAQPGTLPAQTSIGECMALDSGEPRNVDWLCSPGTRVSVDPDYARRAIRSLALVALRAGSPAAAAPAWSVSQGRPRPCATCGADAPQHVLVGIYGGRPTTRDELRDPFGAEREGRAIRRLTLGVLVHSAHCAGGHVLLDESTGSIGLALPAA